jgi:hypothetical protein
MKNSPQRSCDVVIANAGVVGQDDMFTLEGKPGCDLVIAGLTLWQILLGRPRNPT